jgi:hypothetical protein
MVGLDDRRYQVFVSSTFEDLQVERQRVLQAVLEMKAFPAGMELFPSANEEQWSFIQREIESSDYYIVVTAGMYGSIAGDGRSFTEKEYDHAASLNKCVMSFLRRDLMRLEGRYLEQDQDRKNRLEAFREKVMRSRLVKFYDSPEELKSLVIQALVHAFHFQPQEGWVRAKNARRLEDLEEVTQLQKRVMELQTENARLSADTMSEFAQGRDIVEWAVELKALVVSPGSPEEPPPLPRFNFRTTWDALFTAAFPNADPRVDTRIVRARIVQVIIDQISVQCPSATGWTMHDQLSNNGLSPEDVKIVMADVQRQFLGLDLIDITEQSGFLNARSSHWCLTRKGHMQLLAISGIRRDRDRRMSSDA